jgi:hypothetical protein
MTSARYITAMLLGACALLASALVAIPTDSPDIPDILDTDTLDSRYTATVPQLAGTTGQKPATRSLQPTDENHVALPRIWLGSPIAR